MNRWQPDRREILPTNNSERRWYRMSVRAPQNDACAPCLDQQAVKVSPVSRLVPTLESRGSPDGSALEHGNQRNVIMRVARHGSRSKESTTGSGAWSRRRAMGTISVDGPRSFAGRMVTRILAIRPPSNGSRPVRTARLRHFLTAKCEVRKMRLGSNLRKANFYSNRLSSKPIKFHQRVAPHLQLATFHSVYELPIADPR